MGEPIEVEGLDFAVQWDGYDPTDWRNHVDTEGDEEFQDEGDGVHYPTPPDVISILGFDPDDDWDDDWGDDEGPGSEKVFCPTGPGGGVDPTCKPGGSSLPAIPKLTGAAGAGWGPKFAALHKAASSGDVKALDAIKTNPDAKSPYPKRLHEYKEALRVAMGSGKIGPSPKVLPPPKIDVSKTEKPDTPAVALAVKTGDFLKAVSEALTSGDMRALKQLAEEVEKPPAPASEADLATAAKKAAKETKKRGTKAVLNSIEDLDNYIPLKAAGKVDQKELEEDYKAIQAEYDHRQRSPNWMSFSEMVHVQKTVIAKSATTEGVTKEDIDAYKKASWNYLETRLNIDRMKATAAHLLNQSNAMDPEAYRKAADDHLALLAKVDSALKGKMKFFIDSVTPQVYSPEYSGGWKRVGSLKLTDLASVHHFLKLGFAKKDIGAAYKENLTVEDLDEIIELKETRDRILATGRGDIPSAAYFGSPFVVRQLPHTGMGPPSADVPSVVKNGGGEKDLVDFAGQAEICIQVKPESIRRIISSGKMKNLFEGGTKGIGTGKVGYKDSRRDTENTIFGEATYWTGKSRPIYGYLEHPDRSIEKGRDLTDQYGSIQIVLKDEKKKSSTFMLGDSLDSRVVHEYKAGAVSDPPPLQGLHNPKVKISGFDKGPSSEILYTYLADSGGAALPYIEAQIHGGVGLSDIREIRVSPGTAFSKKHLQVLQSEGIVVREIPPKLVAHYNIELEKSWKSLKEQDFDE